MDGWMKWYMGGWVHGCVDEGMDRWFIYPCSKELYGGVIFLPPSDAYVRSFLYLLYTLIKLYYTKALSDQAWSLAPDWILPRGPRIPVSSCDSTTTFHLGGSSRIFQDKMGLIIYVSLLLLTPKILSLLFDPQDNVFLSWAHSYAAFHNWSNCWVCGALPYSSVEGFPWWTSPLQGKDFLQVCEYLQQQSHAMPLLHLMTSTNPKMDWCNTLHFNYGHTVTFNFDYECRVFAVCSLHL